MVNPSRLLFQNQFLVLKLLQLEPHQLLVLRLELEQLERQLLVKLGSCCQDCLLVTKDYFQLEEQLEFCFPIAVLPIIILSLLFLFFRFVLLVVISIILDRIIVTSFKKL